MVENIRPIRDEGDYKWALAEIEHYFDHEPGPGTPESDRFDVLTDLIGSCENRRWPIEDLDPTTLIEQHMNNSGRTPDDLAGLLGSSEIVLDVPARRQPL